MNKEWDGGDIAFRPETWATVGHICKPGANMLVFGGTRTFHRMMCAIEDGGWVINDVLMWLFGSGRVNSQNIGKDIDRLAGAKREVVAPPPYTRGRSSQKYTDTRRVSYDYPPQPITAPATDKAKLWDGWGTGLKPSYNPIVWATWPREGSFAHNALKHGVSGLNISACKIESESSLKRWPADTLFTHHPDCLDDCHPDCPVQKLDEQSGLLKSGKMKAGVQRKNRDGYAGPMPQQTGGETIGDLGGASRFFYCGKISTKEKSGSNHPTMKPQKLLQYLLTLLKTPSNGTGLDPFMGAGSTLVAAKSVGMRCLGIDLEEEYCQDTIRRLKALD